MKSFLLIFFIIFISGCSTVNLIEDEFYERYDEVSCKISCRYENKLSKFEKNNCLCVNYQKDEKTELLTKILELSKKVDELISSKKECQTIEKKQISSSLNQESDKKEIIQKESDPLRDILEN